MESERVINRTFLVLKTSKPSKKSKISYFNFLAFFYFVLLPNFLKNPNSNIPRGGLTPTIRLGSIKSGNQTFVLFLSNSPFANSVISNQQIFENRKLIFMFHGGDSFLNKRLDRITGIKSEVLEV